MRGIESGHYYAGPRPLPQFVITGAQDELGRVIVYASTDLTETVMNVESIYDDAPYGVLAPPQHRETTYTLTSTMRSIHVATGRNFAEAMTNLFKQWSPGGSPAGTIDIVKEIDR